jgi:hypothetical protein
MTQTDLFQTGGITESDEEEPTIQQPTEPTPPKVVKVVKVVDNDGREHIVSDNHPKESPDSANPKILQHSFANAADQKMTAETETCHITPGENSKIELENTIMTGKTAEVYTCSICEKKRPIMIRSEDGIACLKCIASIAIRFGKKRSGCGD